MIKQNRKEEEPSNPNLITEDDPSSMICCAFLTDTDLYSAKTADDIQLASIHTR